MNIENTIKKKPYEQILYVLHRHPITFVPIFALFLLLLAVPVIVYVLITNLHPDLWNEVPIYTIAVLAASAYYLSIYLFFYVRFLDYYLDTWIITNDRIVDIEQHGLFYRVITELDLFRIQDVTTQVSGFLGTLFNYGDVTITTASFNLHIIFRNVQNPNTIREKLITLADEDRSHHYTQS